MSRKVLINRLAEALNCKPEDIPNVQELTSKQMYWMIQHERLHAQYGNVVRKRATVTLPVDNVINKELLK